MHQNIEIIQQHPFFVLKPFHMDGCDIGHFLGLLLHKIAQCFYMRFGGAGTNDKIVKKNMIDLLEIDAVNVHSLFLK